MRRRTVALINDTSNERHIGSFEVMDSIRKLCKRSHLKIECTMTRQEVVNSNKMTEQRMSSVDLVIVNGEGTMHRGAIFLNHVLEALPKYKKAILINSVWDKMYIENEDLLKKFEFITVREGMSYHSLKRIYPETQIMLIPDIIFSVVPEEGGIIGYGDSVLSTLKVATSNKKNFFPMQPDAVSPDVHAYLTWLKTLELHVTGRFHGVCLSIMAETPFLAFPSNSHKTEGILQDMGAPDLLIGSFKEIEEKKELAKEKITLMQAYKENAKKKLETLETKLKELVLSIPLEGDDADDDIGDDG